MPIGSYTCASDGGPSAKPPFCCQSFSSGPTIRREKPAYGLHEPENFVKKTPCHVALETAAISGPRPTTPVGAKPERRCGVE